MQVAIEKEQSGFGYMHPVSKIASFTVKGIGSVRMQALKVVQVTLAIAETFESFFADNLICVECISNEFADVIPPNYAATYDPNGGNIVKRFDWRVPTGAFEDMHANSDIAMFGDTLLYFTTHIPFYRVRSWRLKRMGVVLITRSIFAILESRYFKLRDHPLQQG